MKTIKTNFEKLFENEECMFLVLSDCWFLLNGDSNFSINQYENSDEFENLAIKKRKIDHDLYSWSSVITEIDCDLDYASRIYWNKFFEKIFSSYYLKVSKETVDVIILKFLNKNLGLIETKTNGLNEDRIRMNLVINSTLSLLTVLLKYYIKNSLIYKINFEKILNYCYNNRCHQSLVLEILKFRPTFLQNFTKNLISKKDNLDNYSLELLSKANLNDITFKLKQEIINLILSCDFDLNFGLNFTNYRFVCEILSRVFGSMVTNLNESMDEKFLFVSREQKNKGINVGQNLDGQEIKFSIENNVPNLDLLNYLVHLLTIRLQQSKGNDKNESNLPIVLIALDILSKYELFELEFLEKLRYECRNYFSEIFSNFDLIQKLPLALEYFQNIYKAFKNLNSKKTFLRTLGPGLIEFCLQVLDLQIESEIFDFNLFYLDKISKLEYLKMLSIGILSNLCVQESYQKFGTNLKKRLFNYLNNLKIDNKEKFYIIFLICFNCCKFLDFKEYDVCLDWFDDLMNKFNHLSIQTRILVINLYHKYFEKILSTSCMNLNDNSELDQSQSKYIKIMDKYFLDSGSTIEINLTICEIFGQILKLMRVRNFSKKDIVGFFTKFYNQFLNNPSQSIIVQQYSIKVITSACFQDTKKICRSFFFDQNFNNNAFIEYLEKIDTIYPNVNYDLFNAFFDRIFLNLVLENKTFETEFSHTFKAIASVERNMTADEKYSIYKKFYILIKRQFTEPIAMKHLVFDFFEHLFRISKEYDQKFLIKSIFGLIQISCEYKTHFESSKIKDLLNKNSNFENFKIELVRQWIEIYIGEIDDLKNFNNIIETKFPLIIFDYKDRNEFYSNHLDQLVVYSLEKFGTKPDNIFSYLNLTELPMCKIYATLIREALFTKLFDLKFLLKNKILDQNFLKDNFFQIFEQIFLKITIADISEEKMHTSIDHLVDAFADEYRKPFGLYKLLGNRPYSIFKILVDLKTLIKNSNLKYSLSLFQIFIKRVILPIDETSYDLISNISDCKLLVQENILFTLVNFLQVINSKFDELIHQNKKNNIVDGFCTLTKFVRNFLVKLLNLFIAIVECLENSIENNDYVISCVVWHFLDYFNKYQQFSYIIYYIEELNRNIFLTLVNFLQKYYKFSPRLKRQLKFLYYQQNFIHNNFHDQFLKNTLMLNFAHYGELNKKYDLILKYDFFNEIEEILISVDLKKKLSFKFLFCYMTNLILIELKQKPNNLKVGNILVRIIEKLKSFDFYHDESKKIFGILISYIGPVFTLKTDNLFLLNNVETQNNFIMDKFKNESNDPMNSFFFDLYLTLFDLITDNQ